MYHNFEEIISQLLEDGTDLPACVDLFFEKFEIQELLEECGGAKRSGVSGASILKYLVKSRLQHNTIYSDMQLNPEGLPCSKTAIYDYLKRPDIDWASFLTKLSRKIMDNSGEPAIIADKFFIVDDTDKPRDWSTKVELLSRQYDHTSLGRKRNYKGFKNLTLGTMLDNCNYMPINFSLMATPNKPICPAGDDFDPGTPGEKRRELACMKRTDALVEIIKLAYRCGHKATHILFDSWFTEPATVLKMHRLGLKVVAMLKQKGGTRYKYRNSGELLKVGQIFDRERALHQDEPDDPVFYDVPVCYYIGNQEFEARILFFDNVHEDKDYCAFLCDDLSLNALEVQNIYKIRFNCEFYYKNEKDTDTIDTNGSYQGLSFDGISAAEAVDTLLYMILSYERTRRQAEASIKSQFRSDGKQIQTAATLNLILGMVRWLIQNLAESLEQPLKELKQLTAEILSRYSPLTGEIESYFKHSQAWMPEIRRIFGQIDSG